MTKALALLIGLTVIGTPAFAKDDGGFGSGFSGKAPAALGEYTASSADTIASDMSAIANIEPAAGEEDIQSPEEAINPPSADNPSVETIDANKAPQE